MTWKKTFLFVFALALVASFYYFKVYERPSTERFFSFSSDPARARILTLKKNEKESVNRLTLRDAAKGTQISFSKSGDGTWHITQPIDYPAEPVMVDGFVSLLRLTPRARQLSFEGLEASEFGFDEPRLAVCISTDRTPEERCLLIGSEAAIAKGAYAKWQHEPTYFLVDVSFLSAFDKTLYAVRKKQIFTLLEKEISSIQFNSSKREFEIHHTGKHWLLKRPVEAILGPEAINDLLTHLNELYVKEFLDHERWQDPKLGLKPASRVIQIKFQDGSEQVLFQGREMAGHEAYYAQEGEDKTILLISSGKLNNIEKMFRELV